MKEQEQKDIFQIAGENIKPAVKVVAAGASGAAKEASRGAFGMLFRRKFSRIMHNFYNRPIRRRSEQKYGRT